MNKKFTLISAVTIANTLIIFTFLTFYLVQRESDASSQQASSRTNSTFQTSPSQNSSTATETLDQNSEEDDSDFNVDVIPAQDAPPSRITTIGEEYVVGTVTQITDDSFIISRQGDQSLTITLDESTEFLASNPNETLTKSDIQNGMLIAASCREFAETCLASKVERIQ